MKLQASVIKATPLKLVMLCAALMLLMGFVIPVGAQDTGTTTISVSVPEFFLDIFETQIIPAFEAQNPGIRVHLVKSVGFGVPVNFGDDTEVYLDDMEDYVSAADVVMFDSSITPEATRAGYFLDLMPLALSDSSLNIDDFYGSVWQSFQWDGGLWGMPVQADPVLMFYDRAAFDAAGLSYPTESWTIDDFAHAIRTLTKFNDDGTVAVPAVETLNGTLSSMLLGLAGGEVIDESVLPTVPDYSNPALETILTTWSELQSEGYLDRGGGGAGVVISIGGGEDVPPLTIGQSNFGIAQAGNDTQLGVSLLPGGQAGLVVNGFGISSGTRYPDAAYELVKFMTYSPEAGSIFFGGKSARRSLDGVEVQQEGEGGPGGGIRFLNAGSLSPEAQAVVDAAYENARPTSQELFANNLEGAFISMNENSLDARTALNDQEDAVLASLTLASDRKATTQINVALPPEVVTLAPGEISLKFGATAVVQPFPNEARWQELAAEFAASDPEVGQVEIETGFPQSVEEMAANYECFYSSYNLVPDADLSLLRSIDPLLDSDFSFDRNDLVGNTLSRVQRENQTWAYPIQITPSAMSYNADIFAQAGVPEPVGGWTTSQFEDALRALKAYLGADSTAPYTPNSFGNDYILSLIVAYGGLPFDHRTTPTTINFTDPATVDAIRQVLNLAKDGLIDYQALAAGGGFSIRMGQDGEEEATVLTNETVGGFGFGGGGRAVIAIRRPGGDNEEANADLNSPMRTVGLPTGTTYSPAAYDISGMYISANTTHAEACYRFISFLAQHFELFEGMPARQSVISDPALASSQGADKIAFYQQIANLLSQPNTIIFPTQIAGGPGAFIESYWLNRAFDRYVLEDADLDAELAEAQTFTNEYRTCSSTIEPIQFGAGQGGGQGNFQEYMGQIQECITQADPTATGFFN